MARKRSKRYRKALETMGGEAVLLGKSYAVPDATRNVKALATSKFDETVEIVMNLGVDPRHADQNVRGAVALPHGLGKKVRVLVFTKGEKIREAEEAGAEYVGGEELAQRIQEGWLDFEAVIATPDMMGVVGRLGRILAPRGLLPNPKVGTVTTALKQAIGEVKAGRVEFRANKAGIVQAPVGKASFTEEALSANVRAFVDAILKAKPTASKGTYVKSAYLSSTMGLGLKLDAAEFRI
jgi:large subunit ribosomal protein L1